MSTLITGGLGFVGSHLARYVVNKTKKNVLIVDNLSTGSMGNIKDLLNRENNHRIKIFKESVENILELNLHDISHVFHLASHASPMDFHKYSEEIMMANSLGTKKVLELALVNKATFTLASTSEIYGDPQEHPQNEEYFGNVNPIGIRACYDESKRFSEALTMIYNRKHRLDTRILRIFNTYGTNMRIDDGRVIPTFIWQALKNEPITIRGDGKQTRSFCYVSDLVKGIHSIATSKDLVNYVYNIGNPEEISIQALAEKVRDIIESDSEIEFVDELDNEPRRRKPDISRIKKEVGWVPEITLNEGLKLTIPYYKDILRRKEGDKFSN